MARSAADLLALKAELTNDPSTLGLVAPPTIADEANADALNLVRETILVERDAIPATEIARALNRTEYGSAVNADRQWIELQLSVGLVDARTGSEARAGFTAIFGANTTTRANLLALLSEPGNRVEQMFRAGLLEVGGTVTVSDIADARNAVAP